eukprot:3177702-Rhodomonas_salina.2
MSSRILDGERITTVCARGKVGGSRRQVGSQQRCVALGQHVEQQDLREERHPLPAAGQLRLCCSGKGGDGRVGRGEEGEQALTLEGVIKASNTDEPLERVMFRAVPDNVDDVVPAFEPGRNQHGVDNVDYTIRRKEVGRCDIRFA